MREVSTKRSSLKIGSILRAGVALAPALFAVSLGDAQAQAASSDSSELVVTGSRIRGVAPVGSNIVSLGRADVEASGAVSTTQLIQQVPQVFNLGISENSRGQSGGSNNITYGTTVNLRGIGPFTTLVVLDGHRAVPQGTTGFAVDPSIIPTLALQRVEIVADGASAIYGSDAVAGVVNLILRRNVEGIEATARYGVGEDYTERQYGLIAGHDWGSGRATISFENGYHTALSGRDRDFFRGDLTAVGGGDYRVTLCNPGNITVSGVSYAIPAGGVTAANRSALVAGTVNRCDNLKIADLVPRQNRNSMAFTFDQELTDSISIFGDGFATKRTFQNRNGGATATLTVPSTNAFFVAPPGLTPANETVTYSYINDYQPYTEGFSKAYEATVGGRVDLPADWKFETSYTFGRNDDRSRSHNVINAAAQTAALANANPATALNPFGAANTQAALDSIVIGVGDNKGRTSLKFFDAKVDGPLFDLPGGAVRVAGGYERQDLHVVQTNITGTIAVPTATTGDRVRSVDSAYGEMLIPLVGEGNAMPAIQKLDVDLAIRYDKYSDVGGTTNPKIGANWTPVNGVTFRGSYGTSFRAPTISQIYGNTNSLFVQNYSDPLLGGAIRQGVARSGANLELKPEEAKTWSFGADFDPAPGLKINLTWFKVDYDDQVVAYLSDLAVLSRESQFAGSNIIQRNPTAAFIAQQVAETGFTGVLPNPVTLFVEGRNSNLASTKAQGIDFQGTYRLGTETAGDFTFGVNGTYFTKYETAITATAPLIDQLNTIFNPLKFKTRGSVAWSKGPMQANLFVNYLNSYDNNLTTPVQEVDAYTSVDLRLAYTIGSEHPFVVAVDARNLFDKQPPFVNIAQSANGGGGFDPTLTNPVGRILGVSLMAKF
jgi:iron complex outermembrane receptor protein